MQYPGMTLTQNGHAVTLVQYIGKVGGSFRWQAEDENGQIVSVTI